MVIREYNMSVILYPQDNGSYTIICPELPRCFSEGKTVTEALENIRSLIAEFLPERINESPEDEELLRAGLCMKGKMYQEMTVTVDDAGKVAFPSSALAHAVGAEG